MGTRPNFIKVTRFREVAKQYPNLSVEFVHTGQHFDQKMSEVFFEQFNLRPDYMLNIGPGTPNTQMANIMLELEKVIAVAKPDLMVVVGDVNSTLAAAITANKAGIKLAHLESGLRSFDRSMPEEINRILTDEICDHFFVTEQSGVDHLTEEGKNTNNIHFVGNTMIDSLVAFEPLVQQSDILQKLEIENKPFVLMTMHRPSNVDSPEGLKTLLQIMELVVSKVNLVFPIHPRTINNFKKDGSWSRLENLKGLIFTEPLDYFAFQKLTASCKFVITDSGGIQEETTFRQIPCLTLRQNTERPSTLTIGSNELVEYTVDAVEDRMNAIFNGTFKKGQIPPLWDGKATNRIMKVLNDIL